ncbi:unnamed protein product [Calypogeia fissa]
MAFGKSAVLVALLVIAALSAQSAKAATYKVGGSTGWTLGISATFYDDWAKSISFKTGDVLDFAYSGSLHNVFEVSAADLASCNVASPLKTYNTIGGATLTLTTPGNHFFICGIPDHCALNMQMTVLVSADAPAKAPAPSKKSPGPKPAASTPVIPVATAAPVSAVGKSGASSYRSGGPAMVVGAILSAVFVSILFH